MHNNDTTESPFEYPLPKQKRNKRLNWSVQSTQELLNYYPRCNWCGHNFHYFSRCLEEGCECLEAEESATLGRWIAYRYFQEKTGNGPLFLADLIDQNIESLYLEIEDLTQQLRKLMMIFED